MKSLVPDGQRQQAPRFQGREPLRADYTASRAGGDAHRFSGAGRKVSRAARRFDAHLSGHTQPERPQIADGFVAGVNDGDQLGAVTRVGVPDA